MDYREHPPAPALAGLVKTWWTLAAGGEPGRWIAQQAVPDGCVELIRRVDGHSRWDGDQPKAFAVGLIDAPKAFEISGASRFAAVRLWPWAWPLVSAVSLAAMRNRWVPVEEAKLTRLCESLPDQAEAELLQRFAGAAELAAIGRAVIAADTVEAMVDGTGMSPRRLQRWFARHVGLTPRRYLRMLRFQKAFAEVPGQESLAAHAAEHGFADQAHMAREFRSMAGVPAKQARRAARGPFLR